MAKQLDRADLVLQGERLRMTYEEYLAWEGEGRHGEWVDGDVIVFMPVKPRHSDLSVFLVCLLSYCLSIRSFGRLFLAPIEMRFFDGTSAREPDIAVLTNANLDRRTKDRIDGPADLAIEIVSEDSVTRDRREKWAEYAAAGIPEYWVVEGREGRSGVVLFGLAAEGYYAELSADDDGRIASRILPGFIVDPAWFAGDELPDPFPLAAAMAGPAAGT